MAYPTGSGSEILRRGGITTQSSAQSNFTFDGSNPTLGTATATVPANHIITILNIVFCEMAGADELLYLTGHNGSGDVRWLNQQSLPSKSTFVFSEKIVLIGGDSLEIDLDSAGNVDIWYSYIDQNWS